MNTIKVVGIRWPSSIDVTNQRIMYPEVEEIPNEGPVLTKTVENMLYDRRFNQCLVRWKNILYVCDRIDPSTRQFSKTEIEYHPYISYLK